MNIIPGNHEALCRAYTMRSLRDEGASTHLIAKYFRRGEWQIKLLIAWHERLYPVMPENDPVGFPDVLDHFTLPKQR